MLSYAFKVLNEQGYKSVATEEFNNVGELCAAILEKGVSSQVKHGLGREYIEKTEPLSSLRGKIGITESIKTRSVLKKQLICTYDDFSINSYMNQIIKTTMNILLKSDISKDRKKKLRKLMIYFKDVDTLDIHTINWRQQYNRNNQTYRMLISICHLVIEGLLQTKSDGSTKLMDFLDEQKMHKLYERFILEYYRKEYPILKASAAQIPWVLDEGDKLGLPLMQSDITLCYKEKVLIIDAKYYEYTMQERYEARTIHSGNLYQIFTYVKNKEAELARLGKEHVVAGMLLYAGTDEEVQPDYSYRMSGNEIMVRTLDLNVKFEEIREQLNEVVEEYFDLE